MDEISFARLALNELGVGPHRLRGQNFLVDNNVIQDIVAAAAISPGRPVLEIGPGLGALSWPLSQQAGSLDLVEIESALAKRLQDRFAFEPGVTVHQADAVTFDYAAWCRDRGYSSYQVVANIPYNITTPLLQKLLLEGGPWSSLVLMVQKEACQRICSGPGRLNGPLTLLTAYFGKAEPLFDVPPDCFYPAPAVTSTVMRIQRRSDSPDIPVDELMSLINTAFSQRRKQLLNNLNGWKLSREGWRTALQQLGLPEQVRAEQLDLDMFIALYHEGQSLMES